MNRLATTAHTFLGTIRVDGGPFDDAVGEWDDSTLEQLLTSFSNHRPPQRAVTFSRLRYELGTSEDQVVVRANRPQLLRDLQREYEKLGPLP